MVEEGEQMSRLLLRMSGVMLALSLICACPSASMALPEEVGSAAGDLGIGALSDRFSTLNELGNSLTEEESVVIETRVGVLTSVNRALDDSDVRFTGEVVGDVVKASQEGCKWANVSGAANTVISTFVTDGQAELIQNTGSYHATGTTLRITGTYHVACPEHQGELDVHATSVEVLDNGGPVIHLLVPNRLSFALSLCGIAAVLLAAFLVVRRFWERWEEG